MAQQDLQIRLKVEEMIRYTYAPLNNFPRSEKHVLSAEIRQSMYRLLRLYAARRADFADIHKQLVSWMAHARHGEALPAVAKFLEQHPFRRSA